MGCEDIRLLRKKRFQGGHMIRRATTLGQRIALGVLVGVLGLLTWSGTTWASTRLAPDIEIQAWYRMRHTFQTDTDHFEWAQWRNEGFIWLTYDNFYKNGKFFDTIDIPVPLVDTINLSGRYRSRVDPIFAIRKHYRNLYDQEHTDNWLVPENGFRDVYADIEHGYIGPGKLYTRWGYQQIVWGESDLFRSIDIVNPLRIDQNFGVGEKFDEFRSPILALKALYDIGNISTYISGAGLEAFYTPRHRGGQTDLLVERGWRIQESIRGCQDPNNPDRMIDYTLSNCGNSRRFLPYRPFWLGHRRYSHPWSLGATGPVGTTDAGDYQCVTPRCAPDVPGDRNSIIVNLPKGNSHHHNRGHVHSGGTRFTGSTWFNLDFSLNYLYLPVTFANGNTVDDFSEYGSAGSGPGDAPVGTELAGSFREGLLRCLSASGKSLESGNGRTNGGTFIKLHGADLYGNDWHERKLDPTGSPYEIINPNDPATRTRGRQLADHKHATRANFTNCTNGFSHQRRYTHVLGFTMTYNDFDYTGAVFRLEQSYSTKEGLNKRATCSRVGQPCTPDANRRDRRRGRILNSAGVWRSMVGFDLIQSLMSYPGMAWTRKALPGQFGSQASFLTGQWLMQYQNTGRGGLTGNMCNWNTVQGTLHSQPENETVGNPGDPLRPRRTAQAGCRTKRWNHLFTIAFAGNGYFRGKLEGRNAYVYEPRGKHNLLYSQWWWREFMSLPVDISAGTAWFLGSRQQHSWTLLNYFAKRDLLWFEATYYIL